MNPITLDEFEASLAAGEPAPRLPALLEGLWHDARGDWHAAHAIAQGIAGADGAWLHAYLHRKEGDLDNAAYWYRRAGRPVAEGPLETEWRTLAAAFTAPGAGLG